MIFCSETTYIYIGIETLATICFHPVR
uniref:Uncharacterized protein n=1 Tax=Rhizophora mucronata TaxID=61149 RepID=A0A2P2PUT0_RHIMU